MITSGIFLGARFCKSHKLPATCVTLTMQRTHAALTGVTTPSAVFTPAEEINFSALMDWWQGGKQDEKMGKRRSVNHLRLFVCRRRSLVLAANPALHKYWANLTRTRLESKWGRCTNGCELRDVFGSLCMSIIDILSPITGNSLQNKNH